MAKWVMDGWVMGGWRDGIKDPKDQASLFGSFQN